MNELDVLTAWPPAEPVAPSPEVRAHARSVLEAQYMARTTGVRTRFVRRLAIATLAVVVLVTGVLVWANREADDRFDRVRTVTVPDGELGGGEIGVTPVDVLVVGSDSRQFVQSDTDRAAFGSAADAPGQRSDTMILLRIAGDRVEGVWIPRDLLVDGTKINQTFDQGPAALIAAVTAAFGVTVDHYVEVGFAGFRGLVDELGGVPIASPGHVRDLYSGLDLPGGCVRLDGMQALAWVRSRHLQIEQGGQWSDVSPRADLDRAARQQQFLHALASRARAEAGGDPVAAVRLADRLLPSLTVDSQLTRSEIAKLVRALVGLDGRALAFTTLPVQPAADGASLVLAQPAANGVFASLRGDAGATVPPSSAPAAPVPSC